MKLFVPEGTLFLTKTSYVIESIRTSILLGHIKPGMRMKEQELKTLLNVSSSPIREALIHLEAEGLLTKIPHVGASVTELEIKDVKELYSIQSLLQGAAVQLCTAKLSNKDICEAERINGTMERILQKNHTDELRILNYKFHMVVCGMNVYPWLTRLISSLWIRFQSTIWKNPKIAKDNINQHKRIIGAIKRRDALLAGQLMKKHMKKSMNIIIGA